MKLYEPFQFLTAEECKTIISYGSKNTEVAGTLGKSGKRIDIRNNRIVWYKDSTHWQKWITMFNTIKHCIDWIQDPQISYYKPGERYNWHVDQDKNRRTHQRFFTLTCELQSAPGGHFEIENKVFPPLKVGQAIIFHSTDKHRATSPTDGERISFTIWAMAKNYL